MTVDVVIVGAGIIGLAIANQILAQTKFSVVVVDAAQPCAGATGAGEHEWCLFLFFWTIGCTS
jgi:glycine/D-amino acid oxidase-like deaminating enzyme